MILALQLFSLFKSFKYLAGWGQLSKWGEMPNALQIIELLSISYNQCKDMHAVFSDVDIGHICTLTKRGEGACFVSIN